MKRVYAYLALVFLMCGCTNLPPAPPYDPGTDARIRVYKSASITFYPDAACASGTNENLFVATSGIFRDRTIGMPGPMQKRGIVGSIFGIDGTNEFVVPANKKLTIAASYVQDAPPYYTLCGETLRTITPQAGKDYEIYLDVFGGNLVPQCFLNISEIARVDGKLALVPIPYIPSSRCK